MDLDLAISNFTEDEGQAYFTEHLNEFTTVSGDEMSEILPAKKWNTAYIIKGYGSWKGEFSFEADGRIKDNNGYVNKRSWEIKDDILLIDEKHECKMRKVTGSRFENVYLLICDGAPYMLIWE